MDRQPDRRRLTPEEAKARLRELDAPARENKAGAENRDAEGVVMPCSLGTALAAGIACGRAISRGSAARRGSRTGTEVAMLGQAAPLLIEALLLGEAHLRQRRARRGRT